MKKLIYKVSASLCIALAATSCLDDVLDVKQQEIDASVVFSQYASTEYNVFAIANVCGEDQAYNARLDLNYGFNTDVELYKNNMAGTGSAADVDIACYNTTPGNTTLDGAKNGYIMLMNGIEIANSCIQNIRTYSPLDNPDFAHLLGEALTWRAFFYSEIVKMWGEAPFRNAPVTSETTYIPKSDRDVFYNQALDDLEEAIPLLYGPFEKTQTNNTMRVSSAVAAGLYARIALAATGYSWRPEDGKVGTGNPGSLRTSVDPRFSGEGKAELYKKALKYLEDEVIANGNVSLEPTFEGLWRKMNNDDHISNSPEVLWIRPYSDGRGRWTRTHGPSMVGGPYTNYSTRTNGGSTGPVPYMWWQYEKEDTRRDVTCVAYMYTDAATATYKGFQLKSGSEFWYCGKYRFEWRFAKPYDGELTDGAKPIILRYADILLMASELAAYQGDLAKAKSYLQEVRQRAYSGNEDKAAAYVSSLTIGSAGNVATCQDAALNDYDKEGTIMKALIDERALEFTGEFLRKQDLIRWGLLKIKLDWAAKELKDLAEMNGKYEVYRAGSTIKNGSNSKEDYFDYPVYWRVAKGNYPTTGVSPIEVYGLELDEAGKAPADYSEMDPNGWEHTSFLNRERFYGTKAKDFLYNVGLYVNQFDDPYPRSVWPHFATPLSASQGWIVNDYGY